MGTTAVGTDSQVTGVPTEDNAGSRSAKLITQNGDKAVGLH